MSNQPGWPRSLLDSGSPRRTMVLRAPPGGSAHISLTRVAHSIAGPPPTQADHTFPSPTSPAKGRKFVTHPLTNRSPYQASRSSPVRRRGRRRVGAPRRRRCCPISAARRWPRDINVVAALVNDRRCRRRGISSLPLGGSSTPGPRPGTVGSIMSRRSRPSACSTHERGPEQAPRTLRWPLLLRLAERHCDPGGVRVEVHRLVDRRGDAVVRRARRDRWFSSIPQEVRARARARGVRRRG